MSLSNAIFQTLLEYSTDPGSEGDDKLDKWHRRFIFTKNKAVRFARNARFAQRDDARDRHDTAVNARKEKREKRTKLLPDGVRSFTLGKSSQSSSPSASEERAKNREGKQLIVRPSAGSLATRPKGGALTSGGSSGGGGGKKKHTLAKILGGVAGVGAVAGGAHLLKNHLNKKPTEAPPVDHSGAAAGATGALSGIKSAIKQKIAEHPHAAMGAAAAGLGGAAIGAGYKAYKAYKANKRK